jgi:hypothetical protein
MDGMLPVIAPYAVGTLFGLIVGAQWAFPRGIVFGVTKTLEALEQLELFQVEDNQEIIQKIQEYQENQ